MIGNKTLYAIFFMKGFIVGHDYNNETKSSML